MGRGRYSPPHVVGAHRSVIAGDPDPAHISTSLTSKRPSELLVQISTTARWLNFTKLTARSPDRDSVHNRPFRTTGEPGSTLIGCARGFADTVCRNDLRLGIERDERVLIAEPARIVVFGHVALLLADIGPDLVNLDTAAGQLAHLFVHQLGATLTDLNQQAADRVAVRAGHPLSAADRIPFYQAADDLDSTGEWNAVHGACSLILDVYIIIYGCRAVNGNIYMEFREAVDDVCKRLAHDDVAKGLGVSVQTIRQARLDPNTQGHRSPPNEWQYALIRLAEERVWHYRKLIERLRDSKGAR